REERRLDDLDLPDADVVHCFGWVKLSRPVKAGLIAPIAEEDVPGKQPEGGVDSDFLQRCRERHRGIEARAEPSFENLGRCAYLLSVEPPTGGRLGVADVAGPHAFVDGLDDRIDPFPRALLIPVKGRVASLGLKAVGYLDQKSRDCGRVRLNE